MITTWPCAILFTLQSISVNLTSHTERVHRGSQGQSHADSSPGKSQRDSHRETEKPFPRCIGCPSFALVTSDTKDGREPRRLWRLKQRRNGMGEKEDLDVQKWAESWALGCVNFQPGRARRIQSVHLCRYFSVSHARIIPLKQQCGACSCSFDGSTCHTKRGSPDVLTVCTAQRSLRFRPLDQIDDARRREEDEGPSVEKIQLQYSKPAFFSSRLDAEEISNVSTSTSVKTHLT